MAGGTDETAALAGLRRKYLFRALVAWFFVDAFDGAVMVEDAAEHWFEAAFLGAALLGYLALAWWRPLPAAQRTADRVIAGAIAVIATTLVLRAALPDETAFRWSIVLTVGYAAIVILLVLLGRIRGRTPARQP